MGELDGLEPVAAGSLVGDMDLDDDTRFMTMVRDIDRLTGDLFKVPPW
jgi:hypothetical protein